MFRRNYSHQVVASKDCEHVVNTTLVLLSCGHVVSVTKGRFLSQKSIVCESCIAEAEGFPSHKWNSLLEPWMEQKGGGDTVNSVNLPVTELREIYKLITKAKNVFNTKYEDISDKYDETTRKLYEKRCELDELSRSLLEIKSFMNKADNYSRLLTHIANRAKDDEAGTRDTEGEQGD